MPIENETSCVANVSGILEANTKLFVNLFISPCRSTSSHKLPSESISSGGGGIVKFSPPPSSACTRCDSLQNPIELCVRYREQIIVEWMSVPPLKQKVIALAAKHQTLLQRLPQVEAAITADVSRHDARVAAETSEAQKVSLGHRISGNCFIPCTRAAPLYGMYLTYSKLLCLNLRGADTSHTRKIHHSNNRSFPLLNIIFVSWRVKRACKYIQARGRGATT